MNEYSFTNIVNFLIDYNDFPDHGGRAMVAKALGISASSLSQYEKLNNIPYQELIAYCESLKLSIHGVLRCEAQTLESEWEVVARELIKKNYELEQLLHHEDAKLSHMTYRLMREFADSQKKPFQPPPPR